MLLFLAHRDQVQVQVKNFSSAPTTIRTQVHYNCHIKTISCIPVVQRSLAISVFIKYQQFIYVVSISRDIT